MIECYPLGRWSEAAVRTVDAGELILVQSGEWESRETVSVLRALKTFGPVEETKAFLASERETGKLDEYGDNDYNPHWDDEKAGYDYVPRVALVAWLVGRGLAEEVSPVAVLHLPGYDWEN